MAVDGRRACPCRPLPMERGMVVSMGLHPNRRVSCGHRLVQGKGGACERRAWSCRHPRGKGMAFYPLQGKGMVCVRQRRRERCTVDDLLRGLGMHMACEKRGHCRIRCWLPWHGLRRRPEPKGTRKDVLGGRLDRCQNEKTTAWDKDGCLHHEEGGKGEMSPARPCWRQNPGRGSSG